MGFPAGHHCFLITKLLNIPCVNSMASDGEMLRSKLPAIKFGESCREIEEDVMCVMCLNLLERDDEIRELCNFSHMFHRGCLDKWIDHQETTCPLCRCPLISQTQMDHNDEDWISFLFNFIRGNILETVYTSLFYNSIETHIHFYKQILHICAKLN